MNTHIGSKLTKIELETGVVLLIPNKCLLYLQKYDNKLLIISMIDNLLKGASGQAVHNMNLLFGLEETVGLHLKPSAF